MNKKIAIMSAAFALSVPIIPAFAQVSDAVESAGRQQMRSQIKEARQDIQNTRADLQAKREEAKTKRLEFQDKKEKMVAEKCKNLESRIDTRIKRYDNNNLMFQKVYGNMKTRLTRLSAKLKESGADTTKLDADLTTLYAKIDKLFADHATFMDELKSSQTAVCGSSEGEFKSKIENARKVPEIIKQDRVDIKDFFQTTIKADLQTIREQLDVEKTENETTSAPEETSTSTPETTSTSSPASTTSDLTTTTQTAQ